MAHCSNCGKLLNDSDEVCLVCEEKSTKNKRIIQPGFLGKLFLLVFIIYIVVIIPFLKSID